MQKWRPWETASEADWALASQREPVIRLLAQQERLTGESTQQAMIQLGVSRSVLYKLVRRYRQATTDLFASSLEERARF